MPDASRAFLARAREKLGSKAVGLNAGEVVRKGKIDMGKLVLSGGSTEKDLEFKRSEVNHMRLVLAWLRCEYMLDEDMQRGYASTAKELFDAGFTTEEEATTMLARKAEEIRHVPKYVRHGVKMLTKMLRDHDRLADAMDGEIIGDKCELPEVSPGLISAPKA